MEAAPPFLCRANKQPGVERSTQSKRGISPLALKAHLHVVKVGLVLEVLELQVCAARRRQSLVFGVHLRKEDAEEEQGVVR